MPTFRMRSATVFAATFLVTTAAAEAVFRLLGDRPSNDLAGLYAPFHNGGYKLAADVDTHAHWASGEFSVHTDGLGLRCDSKRRFAIDKGARVSALILGDSQGFGHGVGFEESLVGVAAELALRDGMRIANAAVGGHALRNQFALAQWLQEEHKLFASAYIVLVTPLMVYNTDAVQSVVGNDGRLYYSSPNFSARARLWAKTRTVIYNRCRDALRNTGLGASPTHDGEQVFQLFGAGLTEAEVRRGFTSLLAEIKAYASARGSRVLLVYVPLTAEMDFEHMRVAAAAKGIVLDPDLPARISSDAAAAVDIPMHDLRPVLAELHAKDTALRLKADFHYSRPLSQACGEDLWAYLRHTLRPDWPDHASLK
jgi:hypothetical protein